MPLPERPSPGPLGGPRRPRPTRGTRGRGRAAGLGAVGALAVVLVVVGAMAAVGDADAAGRRTAGHTAPTRTGTPATSGTSTTAGTTTATGTTTGSGTTTGTGTTTTSGTTDGTTGTTRQQVAVPAYVPTDDTTSWASLTGGADGLGLIVANPDSGPGSTVDAGWAAVAAQAHAAGTTVLGYVDTGYFGYSSPARTTRTGETTAEAWTAQVEADVDTWYELYGDSVDGIFFDDSLAVCGTDADAGLYTSLYSAVSAYVHDAHAGALTAANAGTQVQACFADAADVIVTFEGSAADYLDTTGAGAVADWQLDADPGTVWNIVYDVAPADLTAVMARARTVNAGWVYATPDTLPNPYDTAPTGDYWTDELAALGTW